MGIPLVLVIGALVGGVASLLTHRRWGLLRDIGIGIVGAVVGGAIARIMGWGFLRGINVWNLCVAAAAAIILVGVVMLSRRQRAY